MHDQLIKKLLQLEVKRQNSTLPLIASENVSSADVREALGSVLTDKYAEGRPGKRYYAGNQVVDRVEKLAMNRALKLFIPLKNRAQWAVNVQPLSGSPANLAIFTALLRPGDKIMSLELKAGGHLSHGHAITLPGQLYQIHQYGVDQKTEQINYDEVAKQVAQIKPKLLIAGASAYPREIDFKLLAKIAHQNKAMLLADISHIAGLIAAGLHPSPIPYADVVMTTTHKTLRGPRGAIILCRKELAKQINRGVFPGVQGGPHLNQIAAVAVALYEARQAEFKKYAKKVVENAQALAKTLANGGLRLVAGGTDTHLILVDLGKLKISAKEAQIKLEQAGIIINANQIPFDPNPPLDPSGIRLGTAAITSLGASKETMADIGRVIVKLCHNQLSIKDAAKQVKAIRAKLDRVQY